MNHLSFFDRAATLLLSVFLIGCDTPSAEPVATEMFVSEVFKSRDSTGVNNHAYEVTYGKNGLLNGVKNTQRDTTSNGTINTTNTINYTYDTEGYLTKTSTISVSDYKPTYPPALPFYLNISTVTTHEYDSKKRLIRQLSTSTGQSNSQPVNSTETRSYTYGTDDKLTRCSITHGAGNTTKQVYFYGGGVLKGFASELSDSTQSDPYYRFDQRGLLIQTGSDALINVRFYYDDAMNQIKFEGYYGNTKPAFGYGYMRDKAKVPQSLMPKFKGHPVEAVNSIFQDRSPNNIVQEIRLLPDKQGNLATTSVTTYKTEYSASGLLLRKFWQHPKNTSYLIQYEYRYQ